MDKIVATLVLLIAGIISSAALTPAEPKPNKVEEKIRTIRSYAELTDEQIANDVRTFLNNALQSNPNLQQQAEVNSEFNTEGATDLSNGGSASLASQFATNFLPVLNALFG